MTSLEKAILMLKLAARDTNDCATIAYYTDSQFHKESLVDSVDKLLKAIEEYKDCKRYEFIGLDKYEESE